MPDFIPWPKTPHLAKEMIITEKIDGTNSAVIIEEHPFGGGVEPNDRHLVAAIAGPSKPDNNWQPVHEYHIYAQSRKRFITPSDDNFGFARWVQENAGVLVAALGEGAHFGEWWGSGIQRGYGLPKGEKRFSLFNSSRWLDLNQDENANSIGLGCVPELYRGPFDTFVVSAALDELAVNGSVAAPGFDKPEGVIVWHEAARVAFKAFVDDREKELERSRRALEEGYEKLLSEGN